jgi:hypothetical protein
MESSPSNQLKVWVLLLTVKVRSGFCSRLPVARS